MNDSPTSLANLKGEVEVLRELVLLLLAQIPDSAAKQQALNLAQQRSRERHEGLSPLRIATDHAWNTIAPSRQQYPEIAD